MRAEVVVSSDNSHDTAFIILFEYKTTMRKLAKIFCMHVCDLHANH